GLHLRGRLPWLRRPRNPLRHSHRRGGAPLPVTKNRDRHEKSDHWLRHKKPPPPPKTEDQRGQELEKSTNSSPPTHKTQPDAQQTEQTAPRSNRALALVRATGRTSPTRSPTSTVPSSNKAIILARAKSELSRRLR